MSEDLEDNDYDAFAAAYSQDNESNVWNGLYERPASLALVGDVAGKQVLDAGAEPEPTPLPFSNAELQLPAWMPARAC